MKISEMSLMRPGRSVATTKTSAGKTPSPTPAPAHFDEAAVVLLGHVADVRAVGAVDRHAATAGDVADDLVGRHGMAAASELREERVDAHDEHVALARVAGLADEDLVGLGRGGLGRLHGGGERRLRDLLLAVCKAEFVDALITEALGEILELDRSLA